MKHSTKDMFVKEGYRLISLDKISVLGYRPDIILENDYEVLFVEIVVTIDHDSDCVPKEYNGKPVRFIKYYSLDHVVGKKIKRVGLRPRNPPRQTVWVDKRSRIVIPEHLREALDLEVPGWVIIERYPPEGECTTLFIKRELAGVP